ncbi:transposase [Aeromonas sp. V90_14]|uniref:transposase n=1 Tax=Aeromonas TaxID=642 RepID=UPI00249D9492|nr:transposase [Aeromonas sp. V90_14]MDI3430278.1 transposase [Aeromonas sp. V90_14]WVM44254.1 transposase [Aeromonas hydrophila]
MSTKHYPDELNIEAVKQVTNHSNALAYVAKRLDITAHNLYAWIKKFGPGFCEHVELSEAQTENHCLQKEFKRAT